MRFTANTLALQKALVPFNELDFPRGGKSVNSMIKMSLDSGVLTLSMFFFMNSNNQIGIKSTLQVDNSEDGTVCILYNSLWSYIGSVETENVSLEIKDNNVLEISAGNKKFEIENDSENQDIKALDIKTVEVKDRVPAFELLGKDFIRLIHHTIRCTSEDRLRTFMNGVYFHKDNDKLEAVGTTGSIIAVSSMFCDKEFEPIVLKKESLYISQKYLLNDDIVKIYIDEKNSVIVFGNLCIEQDHWGSSFPNFQKVFNLQYENKTVISKSDFNEVLRIFANVSEGISYPEIEISIENDKMVMKCESTKNEIACSSGSVSYNAHFKLHSFLNIISLLDAEELELIYCDDDQKALEIRIKDSDSFKALIMPIKK